MVGIISSKQSLKNILIALYFVLFLFAFYYKSCKFLKNMIENNLTLTGTMHNSGNVVHTTLICEIQKKTTFKFHI